MQGSRDKESPEKFTNTNLEWKRTQNLRINANGLFSSVVSQFFPVTIGCWVSHIAISTGNILLLPIRNRECLDKIMNRGHRCLVLSTTVPVIFKTCCLHCLLKDNNKTKHMTGLIFDEQSYCQSYCIYKDPDIHWLYI